MVDVSVVGFARFAVKPMKSVMLNFKGERRLAKDVVITAESMFALLILTSARAVPLCPTAFISLRRFW